VAGFSTSMGKCDLMTHNPANAIVHLGHASGVVSLWSPNVKEPLVKMLCHKSAIKSLAVNHNGNYMITSGLDHLLNVWDLRTYKQLKSIKMKAGASYLTFSQKNYVAASLRNEITVFNNDLVELGTTSTHQSADTDDQKLVELYTDKDVYLKHRLTNVSIQNMQFCPFEDVLGIGHGNGISSILVPGSGEANFDALEANPYESKNQRRQWEVKALLEKIQPELISLDPLKLRRVDVKTLEEKMIERNKKLVFIFYFYFDNLILNFMFNVLVFETEKN
jgi:U3 small nucleolar RNA-associated protein 7